MNERFQFSMRNLLVATALLALCCAMLVGHRRLEEWTGEVSLVDADGDGYFEIGDPTVSYEILMACYVAAMMALPSMAVGVLAGRPWLGTLCGAATGAFVLAFFAAEQFGLWE
jgi:hypothetical protein